MGRLYTSYYVGQIPLSKLPTVAEMRRVLGGLGGLGGQRHPGGRWEPMLEAHHLVPRYVQTYFNQLNPNHTLPRRPNGTIDFDQCPGLTLWWQEHRGAGASVHGRMRQVIPENVNPPPFNSTQQLLNELETFYRNTLQRPGAANAVVEYLLIHGIP